MLGPGDASMSRIVLIAVPYDSGYRDRRMGAGPAAIINAGLEATLRHAGHSVDTVWIDLPEEIFPAENAAAFAIDRLVALAVRNAVDSGAFPMILSGNCNTALGTLSGLGIKDIGIMWFDAHGDFNTPDTTPTGFFDGMALAMAVGLCWKEGTAGIPGFHQVDASRVIHLGARDFDPGESRLLRDSDVEVLDVSRVRDGISPLLALRRDVTREVYLHIDLDVLDPSEGTANGYATEGGLTA